MRGFFRRPDPALVEVTAHVTAVDIRRGVRRNCLRCPVANAARRMFGAVFVGVRRRELTVDTGFAVFTAHLPPAAEEAIAGYDDGRPMAPFDFTLAVERRFLPSALRGGKEVARA